MLTVDDLPEEILESVFSKLTFSQRKIVRLVSKKWLKICNSSSLTKKEFVKLKLKDLHLFKIPRGYLNLKIFDHKPDVPVPDLEGQEEFCVVHGDSMRSLKVRCSHDYFSVISKVILRCCNIEDLALEFPLFSYDDCLDRADNLVESTKLDSLLSLTVSGKLPPFFLHFKFPNLKRLVIDKIQGSENIVMSLIVRNALTLGELVLKQCNVASDEYVFEQIGPQLSSLYLNRQPIELVKSLENHADKFSNLRNLELYNVFREGNSISGLLRLTKLEFISFHGSDFGDEDIIPFVGLENLKGLDISQTRCTADGVMKCFGVKPLPNLVALKMEGLGCITNNILASILPKLQSLKSLDLRGCFNIRPQGAWVIILHCSFLTHLALDVASGILKSSSYCLKHLVHLVSLDLSYSRNLDFWAVAGLRFDDLETLGLERTGVRLSKSMSRKLFENCPKLKKVFLESFALVREDLGGEIKLIPASRFYLRPLYFTIFDFSK